MQRSDSIGALAAALAKAQMTIEGAVTDSRNPHFGSRYADLASVVDACRGQLAENEIAVLQVPSADGNLVRMTTMLLHSSGEWIESDPLQVQARDAAPQAVGSCLTYLRRYQLAALVGIAPEDDDGEAAEGRQAPTHRASSPADGSGPASVDAISEAQRRRLFGVAKKHGWTTEALRDHLRQRYSVFNTQRLPRSVYDAILADLMKRGSPSADAAAPGGECA